MSINLPVSPRILPLALADISCLPLIFSPPSAIQLHNVSVKTLLKITSAGLARADHHVAIGDSNPMWRLEFNKVVVKIATVAFKNIINFNMCSNRDYDPSFQLFNNTHDWCTIQSLHIIWHAYLHVCIECRAEVTGISLLSYLYTIETASWVWYSNLL
jgi:hypothetical protein